MILLCVLTKKKHKTASKPLFFTKKEEEKSRLLAFWLLPGLVRFTGFPNHRNRKNIGIAKKKRLGKCRIDLLDGW